MSVCTFFGHSDCYGLNRDKLVDEIEKLILQGVDLFYMGNHGRFDAMARGAVRQLQGRYPHIRYAVVLAYLPAAGRDSEDYSDTVYPEGLEIGPPRFAIDRRNRWMLQEADICLCYIDHTWGGAYKYYCRAKRQGKTVINLHQGSI